MTKIEGRFGSQQFISMVEKHIVPTLQEGKERQCVMDKFPVHICTAVEQCFTANKAVSSLIPPSNFGELMPVGKICERIVKLLNSDGINVDSNDVLWEHIS